MKPCDELLYKWHFDGGPRWWAVVAGFVLFVLAVAVLGFWLDMLWIQWCAL